MQPARLDLRVDKGATFRAVLRIMQPSLIYKAITAIAATAPVRLTVAHELPTDWPVWVEQAQQLQALNRAPLRTTPHMASVIDASTLEINTINAAGTNAKGGQLVYQAPLDLTGATAVLQLLDDGADAGTLPVTVNAGGWVDVDLAAAETAALGWAARDYVLDITLASGEVLRAFAGTVTVELAGASAGQVCSGYAVIGGDRGPAGPTITSATVNESGHLIITLENGTEIDAGFIGGGGTGGGVWGAIAGDITAQLDLIERLGLKVDQASYDAFVIGVNSALASRYTKTESDARYDAAGSASGAVIGHKAEADPHTQYLNEERADALYVGLEVGKVLSSNDYTNVDKAKLGDLENFDPSGISAELETKVDKVTGKQLSTNDFSDSLRDKLAGLESSHYRGTFLTLAAVESGITDAVAGDYADVDGGVGIDVVRYIWDDDDSQWTPQTGEVAPVTAAQVKTLYESNPDTNAYGDAEKSKLTGVADNATANQTDAYLLNRANHTGTQSIASVAGLSTQLAGKVADGDARLSDARDWTATEISQPEAETGEATTARKWSSLRVRQAIAAWWEGVSTVFGRSLVAAADAETGRTALELGSAATADIGEAESDIPDNARLAALTGPASVVTESGVTLTATSANAGNYTRFTNASAKTYSFDSAESYTVGAEYHGRNAGAGALTITEAGSFVINPPAGGTLAVAEGGSFTLKIVGAAEADLIGSVVAA